MRSFEISPGIVIGDGTPVFIAGPCVIESAELAVEVAEQLGDIAARHQVRLIFKSSYDKANRTSVDSFRGPGIDEGLRILQRVRDATGLTLLTDVHDPHQVERAAAIVDVLQVPAFLCRQTDLLLACGRTGRAVNIKKGQFVAPHDVGPAVDKVRSTGNDRIFLTERGTSFGYNNLVVDMRAFPIMREVAPVAFDVTHSLQLPGGLGHATAGARQYHSHLARAAAAAGVDGFFVEVHPDPERALSDATTQIDLAAFERLVRQTLAVSSLVRELAEER